MEIFGLHRSKKNHHAIERFLHRGAPFAKLFARAVPGDYVQLDILLQPPSAAGVPVSARGEGGVLDNILMRATR